MKKIALLLNSIILVAVAVGWYDYLTTKWVGDPPEKYRVLLVCLSITTTVTIAALASKKELEIWPLLWLKRKALEEKKRIEALG